MEQRELRGAGQAPDAAVLCRLARPLTAEPAASPYRVHAYGLDIRSDVALPEFLPPREGADVEVVLEKEDAAVECASANWDFRTSQVVCHFPKVGRFRVIAGREIRVTPVPGADTELIRLYIEGMMMAVLLHQRGFYVLHASVVEIRGRGVAFVGHIGAGKSTIALALQRCGHRLIADDNAAIDRLPEPAVIPAFPRVKVYPAIAQALGIAEDDLTALHASQVKKTRLMDGEFPREPVPLDRIYTLSRDGEPGIKSLAPAEAFIELIKNSIPTRWGLPGGREQMTTTATLLREVPVYGVRTFDGLDDIIPLARQIEAHALARDVQGSRAKSRALGAVPHGD